MQRFTHKPLVAQKVAVILDDGHVGLFRPPHSTDNRIFTK